MTCCRARSPDLVLSGVNRGNNSAENALYSGTIGGAMEAALQGLPAIALSQYMGPQSEDLPSIFDAAIGHGEAVVRRLLDQAIWDKGDYRLFYNVNFPPVGSGAVKGMKVAPQGYRKDTFFGVESQISRPGASFCGSRAARSICPRHPARMRRSIWMAISRSRRCAPI